MATQMTRQRRGRAAWSVQRMKAHGKLGHSKAGLCGGVASKGEWRHRDGGRESMCSALIAAAVLGSWEGLAEAELCGGDCRL
ncbi:hypothetical protein M0R45_032313 [Rubus argutus]|uniref:Uncharacterized protein n=1 Tax=Rubus argutus TaxID=59490 RepID=A0AAW1WJ39_RUBAR